MPTNPAQIAISKKTRVWGFFRVWDPRVKTTGHPLFFSGNFPGKDLAT